MTVKLLDKNNISEYAEGVAECLEAFGKICLDKAYTEHVLRLKIEEGHLIAIKIHKDRVVSTATGILERKLIHGGDSKYTENFSTMILHLEDVSTLPDYRRHNFAQECIDLLEDQAEYFGAYKVILQCSIDNYNNFYSKLGYRLDEISLRKDLQ